MIDVTKARGLAYWAKTLLAGPNEEPTSVSTLVRWILDGRRGPDGIRHYLEALRVGNRWMTDKNSIIRFAEKMTPSRSAPTTRRSAAAGRRADERAARELEKRGV
jgi:hypothetical protein